MIKLILRKIITFKAYKKLSKNLLQNKNNLARLVIRIEKRNKNLLKSFLSAQLTSSHPLLHFLLEFISWPSAIPGLCCFLQKKGMILPQLLSFHLPKS